MVTKVFNIQPFFFISIICDLKFVTGIPLFAFKFMILVSRFTRKDNCLFCLYLHTFHFLRLKQKMDSLLFLIKKHNNNKTVGYNQGRAETFGGAGAQSIKGAHGTRLLIGLCSLLICVSKWMLLY